MFSVTLTFHSAADATAGAFLSQISEALANLPNMAEAASKPIASLGAVPKQVAPVEEPETEPADETKEAEAPADETKEAEAPAEKKTKAKTTRKSSKKDEPKKEAAEPEEKELSGSALVKAIRAACNTIASAKDLGPSVAMDEIKGFGVSKFTELDEDKQRELHAKLSAIIDEAGI